MKAIETMRSTQPEQTRQTRARLSVPARAGGFIKIAGLDCVHTSVANRVLQT